MLGYKGFDKDLKCRDKQYEVGETYTEDKAELCKCGLHFCEYPLDVFGYYSPAEGRFCKIEADEVADKTESGDSKRVCKKLTVKAELGIPGLIKAGVEYIKEHVDWENAKASNDQDMSAATNTGDRSAATNTGDRSAATNTGYMSAATNTGDRSAASVEGKESVACSLGIEGRAKGALGCWIVLAEWKKDNYEWRRVAVKSFKVDGKRIKADTYYMLRNGKAVLADKENDNADGN